MQPYSASVSPLIGQSSQRRWLRTGLLAGAIALATVLPSAAVPLLPGDTVALAAGSSGPGVVKRDALLPFEIRDRLDQLVISGAVQDRVAKLDATGYLSFEPRLRNLVVGPAGASYYIVGLKLTGYDDTTTDVGFASSGSGTVGPTTASRDISGDEVTFQYASGALVPPTESRFCHTVTNAPAFHLAGKITITARHAVTLRTVSTVIEGTAAPTRLQVYPGGVIQPAIDAAAPGETVLVNPGTYTESLTLRSGINVKGAGAGLVTLRTPTNPGVTIANCTGTEFSEFTVTPAVGGAATTGIQASGGSPLVKNNIVTGFARYGIYLSGSSTAIVCGNRVLNNSDGSNAFLDYGIMCLSSKPLIANNLISGNECGCYIGWHASDGAQFINNTVVNNLYEGLWCYQSNPVVKNNILTGNSSGVSASFDFATPVLSYNDSWGNHWLNYDAQSTGVINIGTGSISVDPLFLTTAPGDYRLAPASPCRDAGDPAATYNDLDGSRNDMGWTGGPCASPEESAAPFGGFLFTSVGNIPANYVGAADGLATVTAGDANALHIPAWDHAAFGSQPWLFGVFGSGVSPTFYTIECKPDGAPDTAFAPLDHPLSKVKFTITADGITAALEAIGPVWSGGVPYYRNTTNGGNTYWAHESLRLVLNSPQLTDGIYNFRLKAFNVDHGPVALTGPGNGLTLRINNKAPTVSILSIARASGALITECGIVGLTGPQENLRLRVTASHPDGFLDSYLLDVLVGHDRYAGVIASDSHAASHSGQPSWTGITNEPFDTLPAMTAVPPRLASWESCAYQFRLRAWARITNGYSQVYSGISFWNVALNLNRADLDGDGDVDGDDLNIFAGAYGSSNN
jgi:parallel beta-helix repeat protein